MSDMRVVLFVVGVAAFGIAAFYAAKQFLAGIFEGRKGFESQKDQQNGHNAGSSSESDNEESLETRQKERARRQWHDVLGVPASASLSEIKIAYRRQIARYHPDLVATMGEEIRKVAETHTKEINEAYALACKLHST